MFDAKICCGSWREADAVTAMAREAGFGVEIHIDAIDDYSSAVFLTVWCTGNVDRSDEIEAILGTTPGSLVEDYGVEDDRGPLC